MKLRMPVAILGLAASFALPSVAWSSVSDWVAVEGGRVRLVTAGSAGEDGTLHGALEVALDPGWKTYWRDPGDAGVPPQIDVAKSVNVAAVAMDFPPPQRFDDGATQWAGYKHPVAFPLTFKLTDPEDDTTIAADVFLGICQTICVPLKGTFSLDPDSDPDNPDDTAVVEAAVAALPAAERKNFRAALVSHDDKALSIEAVVPGSGDGADIFVAGEDGFMFGPPERQKKNGKLFFSLPILAKPDSLPAGLALPYTLSTRSGSVEGTLPIQ